MKSNEAEDFFHGSRKEIEDWSPKSWPVVAKVHSPILAPPPIEGTPAAAEAKAAALRELEKEAAKAAEPVKVEASKKGAVKKK